MNECAEAKPTFWQRLGYGLAPGHPIFDEQQESEFVPGCLYTQSYIFLDWKDRLRILFSGKLATGTSTLTDKPINKASSKTSTCVLPPFFKMAA